MEYRIFYMNTLNHTTEFRKFYMVTSNYKYYYKYYFINNQL